ASVPVDAPHQNPTLDGQCTPAAATLVCQSGVCDSHDNECGYANGDGPCTAGTAGTVCRSGACSTNGTCEPVGGCNADGDCPGGACNTTTHTCETTAPDAGTPDGGGKDASAPADGGGGDGGSPADGSVGPGGDGSVAPDAGATGEDAAAVNGAYLDGGGLSCGVAANGGADPAAAGVLGALGLVAVARRRRRARASSATVA
ncbi:MAG TPA: MYXO-CTERM sorting domain-containing protein, partial [Polyangiaceae bacterium]|nr:MYXO-CTERM sorting domain-containing protein [Polyangiaceae bacterium]